METTLLARSLGTTALCQRLGPRLGCLGRSSWLGWSWLGWWLGSQLLA